MERSLVRKTRWREKLPAPSRACPDQGHGLELNTFCVSEQALEWADRRRDARARKPASDQFVLRPAGDPPQPSGGRRSDIRSRSRRAKKEPRELAYCSSSYAAPEAGSGYRRRGRVAFGFRAGLVENLLAVLFGGLEIGLIAGAQTGATTGTPNKTREHGGGRLPSPPPSRREARRLVPSGDARALPAER